MRIAGVYPFELVDNPNVQNLYGEPIGLESVLASAEKNGHKTKLFLPVKDNLFEKKSEEEIVNQILEFKPDVAAFSMYSCQFDFGKSIAEKIKKKNSKIEIVAGNRHATTNTKELDYPFDFYVVGEGENTFVELLHEMENEHNYKKVDGIAFREKEEVVITKPRQFEENLDNLPNALRDKALLKQTYNGLGLPAASKKPGIAIVEYSRGCPGFCKFCDNALVWKRCVRFKSAKKIVDEMVSLQEKGIGIFYFMDLNFTASKEKVFEFCNEIESRKQNFNWYCMSNIDSATPKILRRLKNAGCFKVNYGVESTNDKSLARMKKGFARKKMLESKSCVRVLKQTQKTGLMTGGYYIIGFPWETKESILKDAEKLSDYTIHCLNVGIATPHPGTAWRTEFDDKDLINEWKNYDRKHLCYKHSSFDEKTIQAVQEKICANFYKNPKYLENVQKLISIEPRFKESFRDYFKITGTKIGGVKNEDKWKERNSNRRIEGNWKGNSIATSKLWNKPGYCFT